MKKTLALLMALALCAVALTGCGSAGNPDAIVIDGTEFTFPIPVTVLTENGWTIAEDKLSKEYDPGVTYEGGSTAVKKSDTDKFFIRAVYNDSEAVKPLSECDLLEVMFTFSVAKDTTVSFPGGITEKSTYDEVLKAYGDPETTDKFEKGRKDETHLDYDKNKENYFSYNFSFNDDGTPGAFIMKAMDPAEVPTE